MMTATPDGGTSTRKGMPEAAAEQRLAEEMVARAREQGMSLTGPDEPLSAATDQTAQRRGGWRPRKANFGVRGACPITNPALANREHAAHSVSSARNPQS